MDTAEHHAAPPSVRPILTPEALLDGYGIEMPPLHILSTTFKKAPRARRDSGHTQGTLEL